jgi:hypothetical protein
MANERFKMYKEQDGKKVSSFLKCKCDSRVMMKLCGEFCCAECGCSMTRQIGTSAIVTVETLESRIVEALERIS